jgi:lipopolysaccharide export system protein LptA
VEREGDVQLERRRLLQISILALALIFLLVLAFKFKPRLDTPAPVPLPRPKGRAEGTLSAQEFRYIQQSGDKTDFVVTAEEVTETAQGQKLLTHPVVVTPLAGGREERATGSQGTLDVSSKTFRLFEGATIESGGWTCQSEGFRFTPEGEAVSEGPVTFTRDDVRGQAELATYHRDRRQATLEGSVQLEGGEGRSMRCSKLSLDLEAHSGILEGPLTFTSSEGSLTSPRGRIALTDDNRLHLLELAPPVLGSGPRGEVRSQRLRVEADGSGKPARYIFLGDVRLTGAPPDAVRLTTQELGLEPGEKGAWNWKAPGALAFEGRGEKARASSGAGAFGANAPPSAQLTGPVRGSGELGDFEGARAGLKDGAWTLAGEASLCRAGDTLRADRIAWRRDGSGEAEGRVDGTRQPPDHREPLQFRGDRARMAAGGYPVHLEGDALVTSGAMTLAAPRVQIVAADRALAEGGVSGLLQDKEAGESRLLAETAGYDGPGKLAWGQGAASAQGRGYTLTAARVEAHLDPQRRVKGYEATGEARLVGKEYDGEGDRLLYTPATRSGEASRQGRDAVVVQKEPYRRLSAPVVRFAPSRAETLAGGSPSRRGRLEGRAPPPKTAAPKGSKAPREPAQGRGP